LSTAAFRVLMGGSGVFTGVAVIVSSGAIGLGWRYFRKNRLQAPSMGELYLLGVVVHLVMLACMFLLPRQSIYGVLWEISLPVMIIHPIATAVLGNLMVSRARRIEVEQSLKKSEEKFRNLFEHHSAVKLLIDPDTGRIAEANKAAEKFYGWPVPVLTTMHIQDINTLSDEQVMHEIKEAKASNRFYFEFRHRLADGSVRDVDVYTSNIEIDGRRFLHSIVHDVTDRKKAQQELSHAHELMHCIIENANSAIAVHDRDLKYIFVSSRYLTEYNVEEKNIIGRHHYEVFPDLPEKWRKVHQKALKGEISSAQRDPYERADGSLEWTRWECRPWYQADGSVGGIIVYTELITERVLAEEKLRQSLEDQRALIAASPVAIMSLSPEGYVRTWNTAAEEIFGWTEKEVVGKFLPIVSPDQIESFDQLRRQITGGKALSQVELTRYRKDKTPVEISLSAGPVRDSKGRVSGIMSVIQDITSRKKAEKEKASLTEQLAQARKMESVGRLAGGVAHDYNNMLNVILGYTELALEKLNPDDELYGDLKEVQIAGQRSADITRQLLAFSRQQTITPRILDLNQTVDGMLRMLRRLIGEDIDLVWQPDKGIWPVYMDPGQLNQILINLCINARDAIGGVGKLTIETDTRTFDEDYCAAHVGFVPGDFVVLTVSDDGCGMDLQTRQQLFEPFFTTKKMGKGTGLGLATVYGIVRQNNGFINVYSEPGSGSTFKIYLPAHASDTGQAAGKQVLDYNIKGSETILLVEDEPTILRMAAMMLKQLGYKVLTARTPKDAIDIAARSAEKIHLLITDVVMPEMNGRQLSAMLQAGHPDLGVLFMSGYTANVIAHRGVLDQGVNFIQKPFSKKELAIKVRESLEK